MNAAWRHEGPFALFPSFALSHPRNGFLRRIVGDRKVNRKRAALPGQASDSNSSSKSSNGSGRDCQPQSQPCDAKPSRICRSEERFENMLQIFIGNAGAMIDDAEHGFGAFACKAQQHGAASSAIFAGVINQIVDRLLQQDRMSRHPQRLRQRGIEL